LLLFLFQSFKP
jgi:di/tricarboxylate transporter